MLDSFYTSQKISKISAIETLHLFYFNFVTVMNSVGMSSTSSQRYILTVTVTGNIFKLAEQAYVGPLIYSGIALNDPMVLDRISDRYRNRCVHRD